MRAACTLETRVRIRPAANTRLEGLYRSGPLLLTQCEAEGFRRITFLADRPDVMPTWRIVLRADAATYPVLLANGNPAGARALDDGRHEAVWEKRLHVERITGPMNECLLCPGSHCHNGQRNGVFRGD